MVSPLTSTSSLPLELDSRDDGTHVRQATLHRLGRLAYEASWRLQQAWVDERQLDRRPDSLLLLEHDPVFTVGRRGHASHWQRQWPTITNAGIPLLHVDRGGSVTYHGPGQIVGYPILRLRAPYRGPRVFVSMLEETILRTLGDWALRGIRRERFHGVWIDGFDGPMKIAAVGVRIVRGVTMHGFALNVCPDLRPFSWIEPCGIADCRVTSMSAQLGVALSCEAVTASLAAHFAEVFGLTWTEDATVPLDLHGGTP